MEPIPFPPGWEAKLDPQSNRYYFINHNTQTTSWIDPRLSKPYEYPRIPQHHHKEAQLPSSNAYGAQSRSASPARHDLQHHTASGQAASGQAASGHAASGHAARGHAARGQAARGHAASRQAASDHPASGHTVRDVVGQTEAQAHGPSQVASAMSSLPDPVNTSGPVSATSTDQATQDRSVITGLSCQPKKNLLALGPNASLYKGPVDNNLIKQYISVNGPSCKLARGHLGVLVKGPRRCLVSGPQGFTGPNPALHCGPSSRQQTARF